MKKVKILTITLLIIAITMIAFIGVYTQKQNRMENQVKNYDLSMDLTGSRNIRLKVNEESKTVIKDAEGKKVEEENLTDEQIAEKGYTKEETPNNLEEIKTLENYKKSKEIIEKRLEKLQVDNYIIKLDEKTGDIIIELEENDGTDQIVSNLGTVGKFEIIDSETKEVLLQNSDIKQAKVMYGQGGSSTSTTNSGTTVYLDIEFNKEGSKKLEEISNTYVKVEEKTDDLTKNETSQENVTEENTTETTENSENTTEKKITMNIDDNEIMSTSFDEPVRTGKLQLSIGSASTDRKTLQGYVDQASSMATVLDTGNIPVKYDVNGNQYVLSDITENKMEIVIYAICIVIALGMLILMIRYKKIGILGVISYIGFVSVLMLVVRYANVQIAIEGIVGIAVTFILNYVLVSGLVAKANERKAIVYKEFFIKILPIIIMVITFSFIHWTPISSFGMTMFWGIAGMAIYNSIITNSLLKTETRKEK